MDLPEIKSNFSERQKSTVSALPSGTWPLSRTDLDQSGKLSRPIIGEDSVTKLIEKVRCSDFALEYGVEHLSFYRDLRDRLYEMTESLCLEESHSENYQSNGVQNAVKVEPSNLEGSDHGRLVDILWKQFLTHKGVRTAQVNPMRFLGDRKLRKSTSDIRDDDHDKGDAELSSGYDSCVSRAQEAWKASKEGTKSTEETIPKKKDMMAILGNFIGDWCAPYIPGPGVDRRWAIYEMMDDEDFITCLANLPPRRDVHMKDALLQGLSGREVVDTILLPCTAMFADSPFSKGYTGFGVWPGSFLVALPVWADYAGAEDAKSSAGNGVWDIVAPWALALASCQGPAADEIKACTITLYGAELGFCKTSPGHSCTELWWSRGYDGAVHTTAAAIALTRGIDFPEDQRCLDLAAAVMAIHDAIDCEADAMNRTELNLVLITAYKGFSIECIIDTVFAALATNWTATDIYGQFLLAVFQEQTAGSRWGGPIYAIESRSIDTAGENRWKNALSADRVACLLEADILPTITRQLSEMPIGPSWHEMARLLSAQEILASPFSTNVTQLTELDILTLSKGTLTIVCSASCATCSDELNLKLDDWANVYPHDPESSLKIRDAVQRIRFFIDGPLQTLRAWLKEDPRPDAIYRLTASAFMDGTLYSRYQIALLEALIIEDALYHGSDIVSYCVGWLPHGLGSHERAP